MDNSRYKAQRFPSVRRFFRWFLPGLGVKRWLLLALTGMTVLSVGIAILLLDLYRNESSNQALLTFLSNASLRILPNWMRIATFGLLGISMIGIGIWELNRSLMRPYMKPGSHVVDRLANYRRRERGPRIVTLGGGHGLATLLRGLKNHTHNLTAVVTVADDGGSSGRLRESFGILPPGDFRNCLAALSNDEALLTQLFQYRFSGEQGLGGHSFGNLFISALSDITGSFEEAVSESGRVLSVHGRVLPSTLHNVRLVADVNLPNVSTEVRVGGESHIPEFNGQVRRVWLEPNDAPAFPPVIQALLKSDMIVIGPGSLYTSLLPNLLVHDVMAALQASPALKVFVCNIATQKGETQSYSCNDHVRAIEGYVGDNLFDIVLCNDNYNPSLAQPNEWVRADEKSRTDFRLYTADFVDYENPWRHHSMTLAQVLMDLYYERTGPLGE
ncbi:MAG: uridine diphosphate-N-acetylglucosamine-binding protein YvcK [Anaerolineae bacterium]|nr:uridine diphosphate-N-acetylglucosamine-binding protein YvcK [Anaerolineae bacterium]